MFKPCIFKCKFFCHFSCENDEKKHAVNERFTDKHSLTELELPSYAASQTLPSKHHVDPSTSPPLQKISPFANIPRSLAVHFNSPCTALSATPAEQLDSPCSASPSSVHCTTLQDRLDLEMSVLRRQEAVLKLQEEYYTLKIKLMKKQMEEPILKEWSGRTRTFCTNLQCVRGCEIHCIIALAACFKAEICAVHKWIYEHYMVGMDLSGWPWLLSNLIIRMSTMEVTDFTFRRVFDCIYC